MEASVPPALPSLPKRLLQAFISPGELFEALRENPLWFGALAVSGVVAILGIVLVPAELWVEMGRNQLIEQGQEVPPGFESSGSVIRISPFSAVGSSSSWRLSSRQGS